MVNGITWEDQTLAKLNEAKAKQKEAEAKIEEAEREIEHWKEYVATLQKILELSKEKQLDSYFVERLRKQSTWNNLVDIMQSQKGLLSVIDAVSILVDAKVFNDREHARNVIYSTLYSHKNDLHKIQEGVYQLVDKSTHAQISTKRRVKKKAPKRHLPELKQIIVDLKTKNPNITRQDIENMLQKQGFDFKGNSPKKAIYGIWLGMGYANKEIESHTQQPSLGMLSTNGETSTVAGL